MSPKQVIKFEDILRGSFKAGLSAATIDVILKLAPEICKALEHLIKDGRIDPEELKKLGLQALKSAERGFLIGSLSYSIVTTCKAGLLGEALTAVDPHIVGMIAIIAYDTIGNGIRVARGEMSGREMINVFISESFISVCALAGGSLLSTGLGPIGYLLGSFVGSLIGGITYQAGKKFFISLCVENDFTFFGLVRQDYTLPQSIISELGGDVFEHETFEHSVFSPLSAQAPQPLDQFVSDSFTPQTIAIKPLRRGILSVSTVGYSF